MARMTCALQMPRWRAGRAVAHGAGESQAAPPRMILRASVTIWRPRTNGHRLIKTARRWIA